VAEALRHARAHGAQTFALSGAGADYAAPPPDPHPFVHQELIEVVYHTLWETVHVFLEHREMDQDAGASGFLYPFLSDTEADKAELTGDVAESIRTKAREDVTLREAVAQNHAGKVADAAAAIHERLRAGGKLIAFGNGGSATDANDFALDCAISSNGGYALPAVSLSMEPASLSAIANDVGVEVVFLRQLLAIAQPADIAVAFSTSGGSRNVTTALAEARRRGLLTIALLGRDGGEIVRQGLADIPLIVPSDYIPRIQEVQASLYHTLLEALFTLHDGRP
jgi:D-sedoheptulose 7-phosphate isomerase